MREHSVSEEADNFLRKMELEKWTFPPGLEWTNISAPHDQ